MSRRFPAALAALGLFLGAALADKKKLDFAPETGPEPRPVVAPPAMTLPSPHYLEGYPPQYFPAEPAPRDAARCPNATCDCAPVMKAYHVADLVIPPPPVGAPANDKPRTTELELIRKITATVEPKSWAAAGGPGTIEYFPLGMALVVNSTPEVQAAVGKYLDAARKMQDQQVITEVRLLTVSDACFEKTNLGRHFAPAKGQTKPAAKFCAPGEAAKLLACTKGDAGTTCQAVPRLTCLNGQAGRIRVGETQHFLSGLSISTVHGQLVYEPKNEAHELGVDLTLEPTVSADGKSVRLAVTGALRELAVVPVPTTPVTTLITSAAENGRRGEPAPLTQLIQQPTIATRKVDDTVVVPDGGTVVLYGGKATIEETVKEPIPTLSDVPFLAAVFAKDRKVTTTNHLLVVVSARVVKPDAGCDECVQCAGGNAKLSKLMADYGRACRDGNTAEARRLAMECLVIDPTCFGTK
jgi:hypothetical protein